MLIVYYIYTLLFCVETNLRCNVGNLHTTLEHFTKNNFFQKLFMCINSEIVWSKPVLTLPEIHYWHFQASIQHLETKLKKRANLCLPMCFYILRYVTLHRLSEVKNVLCKSMDFTYFDNYQLQQCEFCCKLRKLLAIAEVKKPILRKELSSVFSVYIVIFLSLFLYWVLLETLKWDGWGLVWPICWVSRSVQSCCSVLNTLLTACHLSVTDSLPLSSERVKNPKTQENIKWNS